MKLEPEVDSFDPVFEHMLNALKEDTPLVYTKVNHAFWERLVFLDRIGKSYFEEDPIVAADIDRIQRYTPAFVETGFVKELLALYKNIPINNPNYIFSANLQSLPYSNSLLGIPLENKRLCREKINKYIPKTLKGVEADGLEFKRSLINGSFVEFANVLKNKHFLLVANSDMQYFADFIKAKSADYYRIHGSHSRFKRHEILKDIKNILRETQGPKRIIIQAGGSLTSWLSILLYEWDPSVTIFDIGNALCISNPKAIFSRIYGKFFLAQILDTMEQIHNGWFDISMNHVSDFADPQILGKWSCKTGRADDLISTTKKWGIKSPKRIWDPVIAKSHPLSFIENKPTDPKRIEDLMALSTRQNHYANDGPVSRLLEECIGIQLNIPSSHRVIMCSSCTAGIQIATGVASIKHGKPLRWIGSAFGFMSSNIGQLAGIKLIDCSNQGVIDLQTLSSLPINEWDGILFTNTFGNHSHLWKEIRQFCRAHNKILIVDNAVGLLDRPGFENDTSEIEIISCHHTKPWGCGEGGILIVKEEDEQLVRHLINFGNSEETSSLPYAMNAKISDLSCAAILDRLERMPHWNIFYQTQQLRIRRVIEKNGLALTEMDGSNRRRSPSSNLQFLSEHEIKIEELNNELLVMRKYYRPLFFRNADGNKTLFTNATNIYQRIINIPCHPYIRTLSEEQICSTLMTALTKSSTINN